MLSYKSLIAGVVASVIAVSAPSALAQTAIDNITASNSAAGNQISTAIVQGTDNTVNSDAVGNRVAARNGGTISQIDMINSGSQTSKADVSGTDNTVDVRAAGSKVLAKGANTSVRNSKLINAGTQDASAQVVGTGNTVRSNASGNAISAIQD